MSRLKRLVVLALILTLLPAHGDPSSNRSIVWGVCGHPTWMDYANWKPENTGRQMSYLTELGCTYYRCSFEGGAYPAILQSVVPAAAAAGITVLPDLPLKIIASEDGKTNYARNYQVGHDWAAYAISKHDNLPYWELGNELENWKLVRVVSDGSAPDQFPDKTPGGFVALASALNGAYHGIQDAYATGRASGETTLVPQILYGATFRHWGLLTKLLQYNGSLPCDIISWHWYEPLAGSFTAPIHDNQSFCNKRTPADCLADFKSHAYPGQPMDVWITELNRSVKSPHGDLNGSFSDASASGEDWGAEAAELRETIDDLRTAPTVKGLFVYELFDEPKADGKDARRERSQGHFGLVTGLEGQPKDAFYAFQKEIRSEP